MRMHGEKIEEFIRRDTFLNKARQANYEIWTRGLTKWQSATSFLLFFMLSFSVLTHCRFRAERATTATEMLCLMHSISMCSEIKFIIEGAMAAFCGAMELFALQHSS